MFKISLNYPVSEVSYNIQSSSHNYRLSHEQGEKIVIAKKLCAMKMAMASNLNITPASTRIIVSPELGFCSHKIHSEHMYGGQMHGSYCPLTSVRGC
uniref:Uncharacterized protein n=1 Tax=Heterorhabditis bacteriophora TaxID=37862 RepID=A0A1I7W841_HETBA